MSRRPGSQKALWAFLAALTLAVVWTSTHYSWQTGIEELNARSGQRLGRFVGHLRGQLARFDFIPQLLAGHSQIREVLLEPDNGARVDLLNRYLEEVNSITGAADTYVMDTRGVTLAASNWQAERPFIGRNFGFRPYFRQAMQGRAGHYFALGTTSGIRGYYFSYPVRHAAEIIGVVVLKMNLVDTESRWAEHDDQFIVTDQDGIVFISTMPQWRYLSTRALSPDERLRIVDSRRYPDVPLDTLSITRTGQLEGGAQILRVGMRGEFGASRYLALSTPMPDAGWDVRILSPTNDVRDRAINTFMVALLSMLLLGSMLSLYIQRRRRRLEREQFEARAKHELEQRVVERTRELTFEIEERKRTEQTLRATRDELVQAAKLAVLGQLSASISHELNNPLAAIRSYADNARKFLERAQADKVDGNLARIVDLTDRMAKISSQLKMFARRSRGQLEPVPVAKVAREALDILLPQARRAGVELECLCRDEQLTVRADPIQLEQVLVNLVSNAVQATEGQTQPRVTVRAALQDEQVLMNVEDSGPGIDPDHLKQIFEPFFTTREAGLGLGLSISHQIIESMNGRLEATNRPEGGACFTVRLQRETA